MAYKDETIIGQSDGVVDEIIGQRTVYQLNFCDRRTGEICFGFPATADGVISLQEMEEPAKENYAAVSKNEAYVPRFEGRKFVFRERTRKCSRCGARVTLEGDSCCRKCGKWFNGFGEEILPPERWQREWIDSEEESVGYCL